jgi:hypothetical protein
MKTTFCFPSKISYKIFFAVLRKVLPLVQLIHLQTWSARGPAHHINKWGGHPQPCHNPGSQPRTLLQPAVGKLTVNSLLRYITRYVFSNGFATLEKWVTRYRSGTGTVIVLPKINSM